MNEPRWLSEAELRMWITFVEATHLLERRLEHQLQTDGGLSHAQYDVLSTLSAAPGRRMRMTELAGRTVVSKSGLTYQVSRLEKAGLVRRESCATDERGVVAVLTDTGQRLLDKIAPGHVDTVRDYLIDLMTPEQRAVVDEVMTAVRERVRKAEHP
ncbi:MarR family winged helix-turn-helix transcriptional regulator [Crossiella cryophila]|uniref:DNA-binding MarR family transcriptional regulator n=1 Tax=Crossiella cryophila TaxID=43355 RepID=A0A7W7FV31_9PSEU|nr:MarR family transcriptional regulator [Crossiella cryophila]MBB4676434.1 DNA-binding MarR family transcriptional regulator [Crossiella cryophila]